MPQADHHNPPPQPPCVLSPIGDAWAQSRAGPAAGLPLPMRNGATPERPQHREAVPAEGNGLQNEQRAGAAHQMDRCLLPGCWDSMCGSLASVDPQGLPVLPAVSRPSIIQLRCQSRYQIEGHELETYSFLPPITSACCTAPLRPCSVEQGRLCPDSLRFVLKGDPEPQTFAGEWHGSFAIKMNVEKPTYPRISPVAPKW